MLWRRPKAHGLPTATAHYSLKVGDVILSPAHFNGLVPKKAQLPVSYWHSNYESFRTEEFSRFLEGVRNEPTAVQPPKVPFPSCHIYVNYAYRFIYITHPKSASTSTKYHLTFCDEDPTELHCMERLTANYTNTDWDAIATMWQDYFVFTFVRNPWLRMASSWEFLRNKHMHNPARDDEALPQCTGAQWPEFCSSPHIIGRICEEKSECCVSKRLNGTVIEGKRSQTLFMDYHVIDQGTCLTDENGLLAVDFIGRVEVLDEDMKTVKDEINKRRPSDLPELAISDKVEKRNQGTESVKRGSTGDKYLPLYQGENEHCFTEIAKYYKTEVELLYPDLWNLISN